MLISKTTKIKWNSKTTKRYIDLGYQFTKQLNQFLNNEDKKIC